VTKTSNALEVDLKGLGQLLERRGKSFALFELISNAWDEDGVTKVRVTAEYGGYNKSLFRVEDDSPEGFHDLSHAWTLFASSRKKGDAEKRGRFNLGEKLVIALADTFTVETTKGGVTIDVKKNKRTVHRAKRKTGSEITVVLRMSQAELDEALAACATLIPPPEIETYINGERLATRTPVATDYATLQTEVADLEGFLRPTKRVTVFEIYRALDGEVPTLYELGIPVVATDDTYHVNIMQKVPLNADRDNVPPAFLRDVRALVLNKMARELTHDEASGNWVNEALEDELISPVAVDAVLTKRFGEKRVIYDPSDAEANRSALSKGYTVIPGRAFSGAAWTAIRSSGAVLPAGQVCPSAKPFSPDGKPLKVIDPMEYTKEQRVFARAVGRLHEHLVGKSIRVLLTDDKGWGFAGCYGGGEVILNVAKIETDIEDEQTLVVVLHEFAHHFGHHLTHAFDEGIAIMAARLVRKVIANPKFMNTIQGQHD
jgi:hypothetical protein